MGRDAIVCFDSNTETNSKVQAAEGPFRRELQKRGRKVRCARIPLESQVNVSETVQQEFAAAKPHLRVKPRSFDCGPIYQSSIDCFSGERVRLKTVQRRPTTFLSPRQY